MANISFTSELMGAEFVRESLKRIKTLFRNRTTKIEKAVSAQDAAALKVAVREAKAALEEYPMKHFRENDQAYLKSARNKLKKYMVNGQALLKAAKAAAAAPDAYVPAEKGGVGLLVPLIAAGAGAYFLFK